MPKRSQALLTGKKTPKTIRPSVSRPSRGESYILAEPDRFADYFLDEERKSIGKIIYNKTTANIAQEKLLQDTNFQNLFDGESETDERKFREFIVNRFRERNLKRISVAEMKSKRGPIIRGEIITPKIYSRVVDILGRKQIQFVDFETGRLVSIKNLRKEILR